MYLWGRMDRKNDKEKGFKNESKWYFTSGSFAAVPIWYRMFFERSVWICGSPGGGRPELLADSSTWTDGIWRFAVPVVLYFCRKSIFYWSGNPGKRGTSDRRRVWCVRFRRQCRVYWLRKDLSVPFQSTQKSIWKICGRWRIWCICIGKWLLAGRLCAVYGD